MTAVDPAPNDRTPNDLSPDGPASVGPASIDLASVDLAISDQQRALTGAVRAFLDAEATGERVRTVMESPDGVDQELYRKMCAELGIAGALAPEEYDGAGLGWPDMALIMEESGRLPHGMPLLSSGVLAVTCLTGLADARARAELLPALVNGSRTAAVALDAALWVAGRNSAVRSAGRDTASGIAGWDAAQGGMPDAADGGEVVARPSGDGWALTGEIGFVLDGHTADLLLVPARTGDGIAWYAVAGAAPGVHRRRRDMVDLTRTLAEVRLDGAAGRALSAPGIGAGIARLRDLAAVMVAAEQVGGATRCLELSVAHATTRTQFGRPIGTFQAVKHQCADLLRAIEPVRSAVAYAAAAADTAELPILASVVKAHASETYFDAACAAIQIHGGLGYSWEHEAHLHYKRAATTRSMFGSPAEHRARLADLAGL